MQTAECAFQVLNFRISHGDTWWDVPRSLPLFVSVASVKVEYKREGAIAASGKGATAAKSDCSLLFPGKPEAKPTNSYNA